jgi:hypothetical protein
VCSKIQYQGEKKLVIYWGLEKKITKWQTCQYVLFNRSYDNQIKSKMSRERSTDGGDQKCGQFWRKNSNRLLGYPRSKYVRAYWRSRGIAPLILTVDTAWEWSDSRTGCYTPPPYPLNRRLWGPHSGVNWTMILKHHNRLEGVEWIKLARMGTCTCLQTRSWNV